MKRLITVTTLLMASVLASAGCKSNSSSKKSGAAGDTEVGGPLLPPGGRDELGPDRTGLGDRPVRGPRGGQTPGDRTGGVWDQGRQITPEELAERRGANQARWQERREEVLATFDADKDGALSKEERAAMHESRVSGMVDRLDTDRDGKLSQAELAELPGAGRRQQPDFATLDVDKDGFLSVEEMARGVPQRGPRGGRDFRDPEDGATGAPPAAGTTPAPTRTN